MNVTLDTNCLIDIAEGTGSASSLRAIANLHSAGAINLRVAAIGASENAKSGLQPETFTDFQKWLVELGLAEVDILKPLSYAGITCCSWCICGSDSGTDIQLERSFHAVLFPQIEFLWVSYRRQHKITEEETLAPRWRNAKCDVLALWSHIWHGGSVFVTSDRNFHKITKKPKLLALGAGSILTPDECLALLI